MVLIMNKIRVTQKQFKLLLNNMHWLKKGLALQGKAEFFKKIAKS